MLSTIAYKLVSWSLQALFFPFSRLHVLDSQSVPHGTTCILAANHISHFDPPFLSFATPRKIDWMAMRDMFSSPILAFLLRSIGTFPISRHRMDHDSLRTAKSRLKHNHLVGIFPEGGLRTGSQSVLEGAPLKPGLSLIAQLTQSPVLPCVIIGTDALYAPSAWRLFRRNPVWVAFGELLLPPEKSGGEHARKIFDNTLAAALRHLYHHAIVEGNIPSHCLPQTPQRRKGTESASPSL